MIKNFIIMTIINIRAAKKKGSNTTTTKQITLSLFVLEVLLFSYHYLFISFTILFRWRVDDGPMSSRPQCRSQI